MEPDSASTAAILFWCRVCTNLLHEDEAKLIDHAQHIKGKVYRSGFCRSCWPLAHAIDGNDALELHDSLFEEMTMSQMIGREIEPVA